MTENPFELVLYDKAFKRTGWLGDAISISAVPRHNVVSSLDLDLASNNAKLGQLLQPGARVVCFHRGEQILSGPVRLRGGKGPHSQGVISLGIVDDYRLLTRVLGWPVPENPLTNQNSEYCTVTGPAETVLKNLIRRNAVTRLGLPVTVAPDQGRGANITAALRFHPLYDQLYPAIDAAGIGVTVKQTGTGLVVDCYTAGTARELTEASGVVTEWEWSNAAPEATRVVVGGKGEGTARALQGFTDPARETAWGDVIEVFRDARDTDAGDVFAERAAETLDETAEKAGLKVKFSETKNFRYGPGGVRRGDQLTLRVGPSLAITDTLREAELGFTRAGGPTVKPTIGDVDGGPDLVLARAVRKLAADIRNLRSR
jgi:hypothetical protein